MNYQNLNVTGSIFLVVSSEQQETKSGSLQGFGDSTREGVNAAISRLKLEIDTAGEDWKTTVLEAIAEWPLASEDLKGDRLDYLIGGEAFNWRLLAQRLVGLSAAAVILDPAHSFRAVGVSALKSFSARTRSRVSL